jgi:hypothetical protein
MQDAASRVYGTTVDHTAERHDVPGTRVGRTSKGFESKELITMSLAAFYPRLQITITSQPTFHRFLIAIRMSPAAVASPGCQNGCEHAYEPWTAIHLDIGGTDTARSIAKMNTHGSNGRGCSSCGVL